MAKLTPIEGVLVKCGAYELHVYQATRSEDGEGTVAEVHILNGTTKDTDTFSLSRKDRRLIAAGWVSQVTSITPDEAYASLAELSPRVEAALRKAEAGNAAGPRTEKTATGARPPASVSTEERPWPEPPHAAAFRGLAGRLVDAIAPHTEADSIALLTTFLTYFGNAVGRAPHVLVGATRHEARLFIAQVGKTSKARKGDSKHAVQAPFFVANSEWATSRVQGGLSSGEGLIWAVRDPIMKREPIKDHGHVTGYEDVEVDPGVTDKRLLVFEPELARVLKVMSRQGSTLSPVIRDAWDTGDLRSMTKNSPAVATNAHISILAHITVEELQRELADTEMTNGFANRFMLFLVKRSKLLPEPDPYVVGSDDPLAREIQKALETGRRISQMTRSPDARELWREMYEALSAERPGLAGSLLARAEAQTLRLSMLYALLDGSPTIDVDHLLAAVEVWGYAERSVEYIFGDSIGDPIADAILQALRSNGALTRTQMSDLLGRNVPAERLAHALQSLMHFGKATATSEAPEGGRGRPVEMWRPRDLFR